MLDFFLDASADPSFLQAASEKVTPMIIMTMQTGNDNFMTGSFPYQNTSFTLGSLQVHYSAPKVPKVVTT
jgi:hypothetical protein